MAFRTNIQENFSPALKSEIIICKKLLPWNLNIFHEYFFFFMSDDSG